MADIKKIEIFLPDGDPTGCLICGAANWDGKIFRIPKAIVRDYADRKELQYTGLYFLVGDNEKGANEKPQIYIGEAESLYRRLLQHLDEEFWNECLIIVKMEDAINKAHARYLENAFYKLAKAVGRCAMINSCTPTKSSISEADEAVMDDFLAKAKDVVEALGYRFFTPVISVPEQTVTQFEISNRKAHPQLKATGIITNEGFVILEGSDSVEEFSPAGSKCLRAKWEQLHEQGIIKNNKFTQDYLASSPSTAAAMVLGHNSNGLTEWKTADNVCLKEYLNK